MSDGIKAETARVLAAQANREAWLQAAAAHLSFVIADAAPPEYAARTVALPMVDGWRPFALVPEIRVSCGFPKGRQGRGVAIGQCWHESMAEDRRSQIFLSPQILDSDPRGQDVLAVLLHEMVHATVGVEKGHGREFSRTCAALGFEGPPTANHAGPGLLAVLAVVARLCGPYPHARLGAPLDGGPGPRPGAPGPRGPRGPRGGGGPVGPPRVGRMLKLSCACDRPKVIRASRAVIDRGGIECRDCGSGFLPRD